MSLVSEITIEVIPILASPSGRLRRPLGDARRLGRIVVSLTRLAHQSHEAIGVVLRQSN
jgi:hypothetical protein